MHFSKPPVTEKEFGLEYQKLLSKYKNKKPSTVGEAYDLFINFYSKLYFLKKCLTDFVIKYHTWNQAAVIAEIARLEVFIKEAETIPYYEAVDVRNLNGNLKKYEKYIYVRFKNDYYKNLSFEKYGRLSEESIEAKIYGTYLLYYDFLKNHLIKETKIETVNTLIQDPVYAVEKTISIAEKYLYVFRGNSLRNDKLILSECDYNLLVKYTEYLLEKGTLPKNIQPMRINLDQGSVGYTYKLMFEEKNGRQKIPPHLIIFLHTVFTNFKKHFTEADYVNSSIYKKLGSKPNNYEELIKKSEKYRPV